MMRIAAFVVLGLILTSGAAAGEPVKPNFVLARVQLLRHFGACHPKPGMECVVVGGIAKMRVKVISVLAGMLDHGYFDATIPFGGRMRLDGPDADNGKLFIVASMQPDGEIVVLNWAHVSAGLCFLHQDDIAELSRQASSPAFADELRAAVRRFPCKPD